MCPDWELNQGPLVCRPVLNPLSHISQDCHVSFYNFLLKNSILAFIYFSIVNWGAFKNIFLFIDEREKENAGLLLQLLMRLLVAFCMSPNWRLNSQPWRIRTMPWQSKLPSQSFNSLFLIAPWSHVFGGCFYCLFWICFLVCPVIFDCAGQICPNHHVSSTFQLLLWSFLFTYYFVSSLMLNNFKNNILSSILINL